MRMRICHPFGSLIGMIQMDDRPVSWPVLWQGPTNDVQI